MVFKSKKKNKYFAVMSQYRPNMTCFKRANAMRIFFSEIYNRCLQRAGSVALSKHVPHYGRRSCFPYWELISSVGLGPGNFCKKYQVRVDKLIFPRSQPTVQPSSSLCVGYVISRL